MTCYVIIFATRTDNTLWYDVRPLLHSCPADIPTHRGATLPWRLDSGGEVLVWKYNHSRLRASTCPMVSSMLCHHFCAHLATFPSNQDAAPPWRGGVAERKGESHRRELAEGLQSGRHLMEADGSYTCPDPFRGQTSASGAKHPPTEWQTAGMKRVRLGSMGRIGNREACFFSIPSGPVDLLQSRVADASWQPRNTGHLSLFLPCKISAKH